MAIRLRAGSRIPAGADANCPTTCPTRQTLARLADRWTVVLLEALAGGPRRFGELRAGVAGVSEKMLSQTLRSLERDGLVQRSVLPGVPPGVQYRLTGLGASLLEPLQAVRIWGREHMDGVERARLEYDTRGRA
jgi:DNA-binding HxlR family transcriptional regulator